MHRESLFNCVILLWICASFVDTSGATTLIVDPTRHAPCIGTLSLTCSLFIPETPSYLSVFWVKDIHNLCEVTNGVVQHSANGTQCHYDSEQLTLTLTLLQAGPQSQGDYTCKMRSNLGLNHASTTVLSPACPGSFQHTSLQSPAREECRFYDVYPEAQVHWFSISTNLTSSSTDNRSVRGANGLYNISSSLPREGLSGDVSCRLSSQNSSHLIKTMLGPKPRAFPNITSPDSIVSFSPCPGLQWALLLAGLMFSLCE